MQILCFIQMKQPVRAVAGQISGRAYPRLLFVFGLNRVIALIQHYRFSLKSPISFLDKIRLFALKGQSETNCQYLSLSPLKHLQLEV